MERFLLLVLVALCIQFVSPSTDNLNDDGTITWASLPEGEEYNELMFDSDEFPLSTTWNSIDGFLKLISPKDPPYDIISDIIGGEFETTDYQFSDYYDKFKGSITGFIVLFALGALFILVFPIVTLIFCCCRCCGNCGGKMQQKSPSNGCCFYYTIGLLVSCAIILGGVGTAYSLNSYTADSVDTIFDDVNDTIDNMLVYVDNTKDELEFLVTDQLTFTLDQLTTDLYNIGSLVGEPVRDILNQEVGPAITAVKDLANSIEDTYDKLALVNNTQNELAVLYEAFELKIIQVKNQIDTDCGSCSTCCVDSTFPDRSGFVSNVDYRDLGSGNGVFPQTVVDSSLLELQDLKDQDLASSAEEGEQTFLDIPETLTNSTKSEIDEINDNIEGFDDEIEDAVNELTSQMDVITDQVDDFSSQLEDFEESADDNYNDDYRQYVMAGIFGVILIIAVIWLLGIIFGLLGRSGDKEPHERGCLSNCGGLLLIIGAILVFIFGVLLMILTTFPFIIFGPFDRLFCDPLQSGDLFKQTVDKPNGIPGTDGYFLSDLLLNDSSVELTVTGVLDACEKNVAIYTAFKFEYFVNISDYLDYKQYMPDIDSQFENISGDFSDINILPASGRDTLEDFANSSVVSINFTQFKEQLDRDITLDENDPNDLSVSAAVIMGIASGHASQSTLEGMADSLIDLQDNYINPMITKKNELKTALSGLETETATIETNVDSALTEIDAAQNSINNDIDSLITDEVTKFSDRILGYAEQYVNYVNDQVQTTLGGCRPVYLFYKNTTDLVCVSLLQSLNSFWFTIGWCLFFLLFGLVYSIKLAKYFRRMREEDHTYEGMEMNRYNQSGNKIHPTA